MVSMKVHVYTGSISTGKLLHVYQRAELNDLKCSSYQDEIHFNTFFCKIFQIFSSFVNEVKLSWTSQTNFLLKIPSAIITYHI